MITQELARVLPSLPTSSSRFADEEVEIATSILRAAGIRSLGSGAYSVVIEHPDPDKVIKLTVGARDGYHAYVKLIRSGRIRGELAKYLPKIYESRTTKGIRVTVLEKLRHSYDVESGHWATVLTKRKLWEMLKPYRPHNCFDDYGEQNVMYRRDNSIVITDPWAAKEEDCWE